MNMAKVKHPCTAHQFLQVLAVSLVTRENKTKFNEINNNNLGTTEPSSLEVNKEGLPESKCSEGAREVPK